MFSSANILEIQKIINSEHSDPHHILGIHQVKHNNKDAVAVRAFVPDAQKITVNNLKNKKSYEMELIHEEGYFECILKNTKNVFNYTLEIENKAGSKWTAKDPYSFLPTISDYDIYLFGQGTNYNIYDKLGAHPITVDSTEGVMFGVWAPNAKRVSVIGDFNSWDGRRHMMRNLNGSGVWEIFIPGLKTNDKYKFEIKDQMNKVFEKSDPYGNFMELRPSTSNLIYDINTYQWNDSKWLENRNASTPLDKPVNIYEVHLGSWMRVPEEDDRYLSYVELSDKLISYVVDMGYTHIELLPIEEYPFDGSWGYQVTGYYAPTSRFGNPSEFMYFIDQCHKAGIGVILDWVPAHFPKDAHGLARFDGTALYEHEDPRKGEHPQWGTLVYNYGRNEVKNFLIANALFWIEKYHIDGIRVDAVASMLYLDFGKDSGQWIPNEYGGNQNLEAIEFVKHMNSVIMGKYPGVILAAEESTSWEGVSKPVQQGGLGFNLKWNMGWMNDFLKYVEKDPIYRKHHHNNLTFTMMYHYNENFILVLSHDEVVHLKKSMIDKMPGDLWQKFANLRLAYGFMYGHPGKKLLFMGGEIAQFREWSEARSLDWNLLEYDDHKNLQSFVKDLNHLYKDYPALWIKDYDPSGFQWINCTDWERSLLSFVRRGEDGDDTLIFMCNFTPQTYSGYTIGVPEKGEYIEILNSDDAKYGGSNKVNTKPLKAKDTKWDNFDQSISITVPPLGVCVFKLKK